MGNACSPARAPLQPEGQSLVAALPAENVEENVGSLQTCLTSCCCLKIQSRNDAPKWMLEANETGPPSLFMRLCDCQCASEARQPTNVDAVPQLRGLSGVTLQYGDHSTAGSLETLKWGSFDKEKRVLELTVFGGFYEHNSTGLWTEPTVPCYRSALWCCLMNLGRLANYTYRFEFSEDFRYADIRIKGNIAVFCCCCCPCVPAWCTIPECCNKQYMEQAEGSSDGSHWKRYCGVCSQSPKLYYDLITVWDADGKPTKDNNKILEKTPQQVMVTY